MQVSLLLREKPARLLVALRAAESGGLPVSALARAAGMSVVHASNTVAMLSTEHLVDVARSGREKRVKLTPYGVEIASTLDALLAKLVAPKETQPLPAASAPPPAAPTAPQQLEFPQPPPQEKKPEPSEPPSE